MTNPFQGFLRLAVVASDPADPDQARYAGSTIVVPPNTNLGTPDTPVRFFEVWGHAETGGPTGTQFTLIGTSDPVTVEFVRTIPGPHGWPDTGARTVYRQQVRRLIQAGIPAVDARDVALQLYNACRANILAGQAGG